MAQVNGRVHRVTRRVPVEMLAEEAARLHRVPDEPHTVVFGLARKVPANTPMVTFEHGQYSVPQHLLGEQVWVRAHGAGADEQVIVVHHGRAGPGRGRPAPPGRPRLPADLTTTISAGRPRNGPASTRCGRAARPRRSSWPSATAPASGCRRLPRPARRRSGPRWTPRSPWPRSPGTPAVDWALGHAAVNGRFAHTDLASILNAHPPTTHPARPAESRSLAQGTSGWAQISQAHPVGHRGVEGGRVSAAPELPVEVEQLMRQLKMPYARALAPELIATAKAQRWDPAEVIKALFVEEVAGRGRSMLATRRKAAGFPTGKTFHAWDPTASSIPAPTQQALRTLEWVHRRENLVVCGPSGTGKTFFLEALGQAVVETGRRVAWFTLEDLGVLVRAHRTDDTVTKAVARILRADLVIVDDIGLLPVAHDAAEGLYRIVDAAYEKRSIALSSNLHPSGFDELMPKTLATATVDRLLHHAHVCQTSGDSIRLTQALTGKGVNPLT